MSVVTQQPGFAPSGAMSPTGEWSTKMCDCFDDCPICLFGLCFPTCLGCYVANKYGENCLLPCAPGGMTAMRTHMRLSYGIQGKQYGGVNVVCPTPWKWGSIRECGTICNDSLLMCFCGLCEICRMAREVRRHSH